MVKTKIVNVVATASINQVLDFKRLKKFKGIFHDPTVYGGRVAYFKKPKMEGKTSIFTSGKMISAGTRSEKQAINELELTANFLVEKGLAKENSLKPTIRNLVVVADLETSVNLETLSENAKAIYEPEQFPGAILRLEKPFKASILLFASGKAVITGLKRSAQIEPTTKQLLEIIAPTE
jgi:transcription initiation factor TFIID TATA-box-binding protein